MIAQDITMPASVDAERAVLGAVLLGNEVFYQTAVLDTEAFYLSSHRMIHLAMRRLNDDGQPIDLVTLTNELIAMKQMEAVGGVTYISSLTEGLPQRENIEHYVRIVKEEAMRRDLIHACNRGVGAALDHSQTVDACMDAVNTSLLNIAAESTKQPALHVCQFSDEVFNDLERVRNHGNELVGLPTGVAPLDLITTGIRTGELWVLGGRPGEGKSSLALQVATENLRQGTPVAVFSLEMSRSQVLHRIWAQYGNLPFKKLRNPWLLSEVEYSRLKKLMAEVANLPLYVDDSSSLSIREIAARARLLIQRHGVKLILVDYVQLIDAEGKDERQRITRISQALRQLAKEGVPVIALSQLSRPKDGSLNTRPNKFSLKESGALEADAHTVLLIFRPVDAMDQPTGEDEIIVAKQRNGPCSIEPVYFDNRALIYRERDVMRRAASGTAGGK